MEQQPQFLKSFSKKESQPERDQLAQEIREKRRTYFDAKDTIETKESEKSETLKEIEALRDQVESYNDESFLVKVKDYFAIKKVEAQLQEKFGQQSSLEDELSKTVTGRPDLEETRQMISDFYASEKKKWAEAPYSKEDIAKNFTEEHLISLSLEDYATLLSRFPSEMITHITRQGVRDHAELGNHQRGLGEYHSGFTTILQVQELRSSIGIALQEKSKEDAIANYLHLDDCPSRNAALGSILTKFDSAIIGNPNAFADHAAIHFATESIADAFYGSERNNEIFIAFPSALIASQHRFDDSDKNDQYVWTDLEKGLNINTGIAFIPEDAQVDPDSGSRYELGKDKKPVPPKGIQEITAARFGEKPGFVQDFFQKLQQYLSKHRETDKNTSLNDPYIQSLFQKYSIHDKVAQSALLDGKSAETLCSAWGSSEEAVTYDKILTDFFRSNDSAPYKLAEHPISSKDYWEGYFNQHPELRPKHIVYYSGGDPTTALSIWKQQNGLQKKGALSDIGFSENSVSKNERNDDSEKQRMVSIARSLVDKKFPVADGEPVSYKYDWNE